MDSHSGISIDSDQRYYRNQDRGKAAEIELRSARAGRGHVAAGPHRRLKVAERHQSKYLHRRLIRDWRVDQWTPYDVLIAGIWPGAHEWKVEDGARTRDITRPTRYFEITPASPLISSRAKRMP